MDETSELIQQRVRKLEELKKEGINPYPNQYKAEDLSRDIIDACGPLSDEELHALDRIFSLAGRIVAVRDFGKASFIQIQDRKGKIQAYVRKDLVGESAFQLFKKLDHRGHYSGRGKGLPDQDP